MDHISAHIKVSPRKKERSTERGELMEYFRDKLNRERVRDGLPPLSMPRMGRILMAIPTKDLYYLQKLCDRATNFSKKFWWEVNPKKHKGDAQILAPEKPTPKKGRDKKKQLG